MISVLILTKNEEINLPGCIASVKWSDDIVVLDSLSSDRTPQLATELGARLVQRAFTNWSDHQNWAVRNITFRHPWVLYIDADERCDHELREELRGHEVVTSAKAAFRVRRKDYFMGCWLKRAQLYPTWITRVFRPEKMRYERLVNPVAVVEGETGDLRGHLIHHPFSHGVSHWLDRHNSYSTFEAADLIRELQRPNDLGGLVSKDPTRRRKALKRLAYGLPGRPGLVWSYLLFVRLGILDGKAGVTYATLRAIYEYMINLKVAELRRKQAALEL